MKTSQMISITILHMLYFKKEIKKCSVQSYFFAENLRASKKNQMEPKKARRKK